MVTNAAAAIENHKQEVNDLNVFPVPDGDTGINMSLTMGAAEKAMAAITPGTLGQAAEVTASALLRGARGNSGVILSLLFRGFAKKLKENETASSADFASALVAGVDSAYKAVMKPAEGTILTVSRLAAGAAIAASVSEDDVEVVLEKALAAGHVALADTINQNPVLKKAGVIDAGAKGYLYMLDGMLKAMRGEVIEKESAGEAASDKADFTQYAAEDIEFAYCTEFLIDRTTNKGIDQLHVFLDKRGDSIVIVDDDAVIKVHIHTNEPGEVLTEALTYGALLSIKIENMREQHTEAAASEAGSAPAARKSVEPVEQKSFAFVSVCAGAGIEEVFRDLGIDRLIEGGQTMNPSTEDILERVLDAPSDIVIVLPNNKNIIMAAEQCIPLTEKRVIVIPTKSIPQGVSAMLSIDGAESIDAIIALMNDAIKRVHTAQITKAVRASNFDGIKIKKGEHIALLEDALVANGSGVLSVVDTIAETLSGFSPEFLTIFVGEEADDAEAEKVADRISAAAPGSEITIIRGEQPVYHYIISAE